MAYREREGGVTPLLLIHGNMSSSTHWDILMEHMPVEYKIYAIDLRGCGESSYKQPFDSLYELAEDIFQFVVQMGLSNAHVVGWSTGGGVAMCLAARHPQIVKTLTLMCSISTRGYPIYKITYGLPKPIRGKRLTTKEEIERNLLKTQLVLKAYEEHNHLILKVLWNLLVYQNGRPHKDRYHQYLEEMCKQRNLIDIYDAINTFNISEYDNGLMKGSGDVNHIKAPVLVITGEEDRVIPREMSHELVKDLGPEAKHVRLPHCGHSPLSDDLHEVVYQLTTFIEMNCRLLTNET